MKIQEKISDIFSKITEKNRYLVVGTILLCIFLADYFFVLKKQLELLNMINPDLAVLQQDIKEVKETIPQVHIYQNEISRMKDQFRKKGYRIPAKEEVSFILEGISRIANQNKIKIDQMMPIKGVEELLLKNKEGKYYSFNVFLQVQGSYHDIGRFFNSIETDPIFKSISAFTMTANPQDTTHHSVKMTIKAIIVEKNEPQGQKAS